MKTGLDNGYLRSANYDRNINGRVSKSEYIEEQKKLLGKKQKLLSELQSEAQDCIVRGIMPPEYATKTINKLKNEIIPNIKESINRERSRM